MNRRLIYTETAEEDLVLIADFISDETGSEDIAESFLDQLDRRCRRLAELPGTLGTPRPELSSGLRSTPHRGYMIFFRYAEGALEIVNILHGRRDIVAHYVIDPD